ncbi:MAG: CoA-binding protein [Syntrophales bacterium]|jgi:acetyltransferase|nr:CoA-binding protein [Syntrophales bacterium]MCK9527305.1 CoA-binding protein [Syntrophales bacterium]MDX9921225.1 CoA-binding protein [Syntrophales bacterium]
MKLKPLFEPGTMAVFGVSATSERHPANVIYEKNKNRYPLEVFAVNPKGGKLRDTVLYPLIADVPEKIDLAVIAARAEFVPDILIQCIDAGVKSAAIISGGFTEGGRPDLQHRLVDISREADFPFIGPNCLGLYVPHRLDTFFLPMERMITPGIGDVAIVSQSGGILVDQMIKFTQQGVGISKAVSIGNKAVIREIDLLRYLRSDSKTNVIAFYIEGFNEGEGREFVKAADCSPKPVVLMKSGKTEAGHRAVSSHTASLAGDYAGFQAAVAQHNILEAANEHELVAFCEVLSAYRQPIEGKIGIITASGGHGAMAVDACALDGMSVPEFNEATQSAVRSGLSDKVSPIASVANPVDLTGSATDDDFVACVKALGSSTEIDCVIVLLLPYIPGVTLDIGVRLSQAMRPFNKPLIAYVPHVEKYNMMVDGFEFNGTPVSSSIEGAVLMAKALMRKKPC